MKTSHINRKLKLDKITITALSYPHTVKGGGDGKNNTYTVRTTTITITDTEGS